MGVWLTEPLAGRATVVKRLQRPGAGAGSDLGEATGPLLDPTHPHYWRREADVARSGAVELTPGVVGPAVVDVTEDTEGITVVTLRHERELVPGLHLAASLGRFSTAPLLDAPWLATQTFTHRLRAVERRGGWTTLERTTVADVSAALWHRRAAYARRLGEVRQVLHHGDAAPTNFLAPGDDALVAVDWAGFGTDAVGADLGYASLGLPEGLEHLVDAFVQGSGRTQERVDVLHVARIVSVFTVLTRADWALSRAAGGEGALAGKFTHPSVAPYLRALRDRHEDVAALLGI